MILEVTRDDGRVFANRMLYQPSDRTYRPDWNADWGDIDDWGDLMVPDQGLYDGTVASDVIEPEQYEESDGTLYVSRGWSWRFVPETEKDLEHLRSVVSSRDPGIAQVQLAHNPSSRIMQMALEVVETDPRAFGEWGASGATREEILEAHARLFPGAAPELRWRTTKLGRYRSQPVDFRRERGHLEVSKRVFEGPGRKDVWWEIQFVPRKGRRRFVVRADTLSAAKQEAALQAG